VLVEADYQEPRNAAPPPVAVLAAAALSSNPMQSNPVNIGNISAQPALLAGLVVRKGPPDRRNNPSWRAPDRHALAPPPAAPKQQHTARPKHRAPQSSTPPAANPSLWR
jgi:hypothetical protein